MDWKEIKSKYPTTLREYIDWCEYNYNTDFILGTLDMPEEYRMLGFNRDLLYDFFDIKSIRCSIGVLWYGKFQPKCYVLEEGKWVCNYNFNSKLTREEAELTMFTEAFSIVEGRVDEKA